MTQRSRFFDSSSGDRVYDSAAWAQVVAGLTTNGVVAASGYLGVTEASPPAMSVLVALGKAFVEGYMLEVYSAAETLAIAAADGTNARVDRIVVRRSLTARSVVLAVLTGVPGVSPSAPALTQDPAGVYEVSLAQVLVPAASSSVINARITDERSISTPHGDAAVGDGDVTTAKLADGSVTTPKLGASSVSTAKIADDAVTTPKIAAAARRLRFVPITRTALLNAVNGQIVIQTLTCPVSVPTNAYAVELDIMIRRNADGDNEALSIFNYDGTGASVVYTSGVANRGGSSHCGPVVLGGASNRQFKWVTSDAGADNDVFIHLTGYWTYND